MSSAAYRRASGYRLRASPTRSRISLIRRVSAPPTDRSSTNTTCRPTTLRWRGACARLVGYFLARQTRRSSAIAPPPPSASFRRPAILGTSAGPRADRAEVLRRQSPPASVHSPRGLTAADRSDIRRVAAAWSASSRRVAASPIRRIPIHGAALSPSVRSHARCGTRR